MSSKPNWFSLRQRGASKRTVSLSTKPVNTSDKSANTSDKAVRFNFSHDWQSSKSVEECNIQMLQHGFMTDVIFYVGSGKKREMIKAHKYMLASRSSVFFAKFGDGQHTEDVFAVDDIEPDIFNKLIRYIYTDEIELTTRLVTGMLYAAKKYNIGGLVTKCCQKLSEGINVDTVCILLEQAHEYKDVDLEKDCLYFIFKNAHPVFKTSSFNDLCTTCLTKVIQADDLNADESKVYEALFQWSTRACKKQKLTPNPDNRSRVIGRLIYFVRFPVLDLEYFVQNVPAHGLLSKDEIIQLFKYFHSRTSPSVVPFISRRRALTRAIRFETTSGAWNVGNYIFDSIRFQSSRDFTLDGVILYGCFNDVTEYDVSVRIVDNQQKIMVTKDAIIETDVKTEMYDLLLDNGVSLEGMEWYTILLNMEGPQTKRGVSGRTMVYCEQVQFMFQNSGLTHNCTTEREGQIPGIIFH